MSLNLRLDSDNSKQSNILTTNSKGTYGFVAASVDVNVLNENNQEEKILSVKLELKGEVSARVIDAKLVISLSYLEVGNFLQISSSIENINTERASANLQKELIRIADLLNNFLYDFDILGKLNNKLAVLSDFRLKEVSLNSYAGYNGLSFDFKQ